MKRTAKYAGLDVHAATTVASVRDESGRVIARLVMPTEQADPRFPDNGARGSLVRVVCPVSVSPRH